MMKTKRKLKPETIDPRSELPNASARERASIKEETMLITMNEASTKTINQRALKTKEPSQWKKSNQGISVFPQRLALMVLYKINL
jgi:hypothetical protein